jgi:oligopeptide transport system substrate-binding protein
MRIPQRRYLMGDKKLKFLILIAVTAMLALAVVACGGGEKKASEDTPSTTGEAAPADQQVLIAQSAEPEFFDPHRSNFEQDIAVERMLFRGLYQLELDSSDKVVAVPAMADGEPTIAGNVYTVKVKAGLKWSDGQPLTAKDFEYSLKRECDAATAGPYQYVLGAGMLDLVGCDAFFNGEGTADDVGIKAVDDTTLEITLKAPKPTFTTIMSLWATFPVRQDIVEKFGEKWTDPANIVVNGPFTLTEFVAKDHVTLAPNPNWALEPKPLLQKITVKFIDDLEVAFRGYQTGELDMTNVPATEIPTIENDATLKSDFLQIGSLRIWSVEMQMKNEVLKNENVRLALSRAIDRESLVKVVYNDAYLPATYWLVEGIQGFQGNGPFENLIGFDPEAAKQALADAGYPDGQGFPTLTITVTDRPDRKAEGEFLQQAWKEILGINTEIQAVDAKTRSSTFNSKQFQLFPGGWQNDYPDPENSLIGLFDTGGGNNQYECSDPDIDAKLAAAGAETDNATRIKDLQDAETLIVTRLCGMTPMWQGAFLYLVDPKVGGIRANGAIDASMPGNWCPECWFIKSQ